MSSVNASVNNKFSVRLAKKVHRLKKMLKPVIRFMNNSKKVAKPAHSCDCPTQKSTLWRDDDADADVSEADQNDANEALEARLRDDLIQSSNQQGGVISVWIQGRLTLVPIVPGHFERIPVPVSFTSTSSGDFLWAPLPDSDICLGGGQYSHTTGQTAQEQVPYAR